MSSTTEATKTVIVIVAVVAVMVGVPLLFASVLNPASTTVCYKCPGPAGTYSVYPDFRGNITMDLNLTEGTAPAIGNVTFWFFVNNETVWTFQLTHYFPLDSVHFVLEWSFPTFHLGTTNLTFIESYATAPGVGWTSQTQEWLGVTVLYNETGSVPSFSPLSSPVRPQTYPVTFVRDDVLNATVSFEVEFVNVSGVAYGSLFFAVPAFGQTTLWLQNGTYLVPGGIPDRFTVAGKNVTERVADTSPGPPPIATAEEGPLPLWFGLVCAIPVVAAVVGMFYLTSRRPPTEDP